MKKKKILPYFIIGFLLMVGILYSQIKPNTNSIPPNMNSSISHLPDTSKNETEDIESIERDIHKLTIAIKDGTLTNTSATLVMKDTNEEPYGYDGIFTIDKKKNGKWEELTPIDMDYTSTSLPVLPRSNIQWEDKIDWSELYGELKKGEYRLVIKIYDNNIKYVEFTID